MKHCTSPKKRKSPFWSDVLATFISCIAFCLLYVNFQPTPVGADPRTQIASIDLSDRRLPPPSLPEVRDEPVVTLFNQADAVERAADAFSSAMTTLEKLPAYSSRFVRQERVKGELLPLEEVDLRVRHAPFSVYMKWKTVSAGRQVCYIEGENNNRLGVKGGGFLSRLPALWLTPTDPKVMKSSRHPITEAGLLNFCRIARDDRKRELGFVEQLTASLDTQFEFEGMSWTRFMIEYGGRELSGLSQVRSSVRQLKWHSSYLLELWLARSRL